MAYLIAQLKVSDYGKWRVTYNEVADKRKEAGCIADDCVLRSPDDSNQITVLQEWETIEQARTFFGRPEVRQAMQRAGVQGPPNMQFLERV